MSSRSFLPSNKIAFSKIDLGKFFYNMYNNYTKFLILQFAGSFTKYFYVYWSEGLYKRL